MSEPIAQEPVAEPQAPPPEPVAPPEPEPQAAAPPADDDATFDAQLAEQTIDLPEGEKLVPLSAVKTLREKLKAAKQGTAEAQSIKQQLEQAQQQLQAVGPLAEAFRALQQAQGQGQAPPAPAAPQGPTPQDIAELEEIARDFDFYKGDGALDLDKASRVKRRTATEAERIAQQTTAPLVQHTLSQQAQFNIARAKATTIPGTEDKADPEILDALVSRIAQQPNGLQTLADPEAVKQVWLNAFALSQVKRAGQRPAQAPAAAAPVAAPAAPPVFTERAGGQIPSQRQLSSMEKKAAKEAGMTEAEYLKEASAMPWGASR